MSTNKGIKVYNSNLIYKHLAEASGNTFSKLILLTNFPTLLALRIIQRPFSTSSMQRGSVLPSPVRMDPVRTTESAVCMRKVS